MKQYKNIKYGIWNKHYLKLVNPAGLIKDKDGEGNYSVYKTGERFISLPEDLEMTVDEYAEILIDKMYQTRAHFEKEEIRRLIAQKNVEIL